MLASIVTNYLMGLTIDHAKHKKLWLAFGVSLNLLPLLFFKYSQFFAEQFGWSFDQDIHLPLGISFFTFQALSYLVDVYRQEVKAERNPLNLGLFISLFPQLIAGPIVRFKHIAEQLKSRTVGLPMFVSGVERFVFGLAKKLLIANTLAVVADDILALPQEQISLSLAWIAMTCYALQIYFDFSAYSDMAIGLGRMFGFRFLENFNYPYVAQSIQEFWRRWHMSLSGWFRDYLYIPLGGNRKGSWRTYLNLFLVFFLCGLWHGASWNFVIWGMIHGAFLVIERLGVGQLIIQTPRIIRHVYVCLVVLVAWVFFRIEGLPDALGLLNIMFTGSETATYYSWNYFFSNQFYVVATLALILASPVAKQFSIAPATSLSITQQYARTALVSSLLLLSVVLVSANTYNPFIYFRF
ncbi:MBOAT family O-acyltransferase [Marinicella rhabdoformis]|uniref:MBOAT family O-acyltransferase n=1 Tax=Marinicella rhabdoformis TaxID=2580566 RepID=UPI001C550C68|nr:MBOAT family O-acyltransferase [Marinicella rhabdoformis]